MASRIFGSRPSRWVLVLAVVLVGAICGVAIQQSVVVRAQWRILPYQSLRIDGGDPGSGLSSARLVLRAPTALDRERGYIERENAVRMHVVSNTNWVVQVWTDQPTFGELPIETVQLRGSSGEYLELSTTAQVLASGANGVFEIPIDYRIALDAESSGIEGQALEVVYTILSN